MPPPMNLTAATLLLLRSLENFVSRFTYKAMIATIDASLRGERAQTTYVEDMIIAGTGEDILSGRSWNSKNIILITASDVSMKRPQPSKYTEKPNDVVLCERHVMYLPYFFPWSSCAGVNTKGAFNKSCVTYCGKTVMNGVSAGFNFYQTLWSLPDHLIVKAFEQVWSKEDGCPAFENPPFEKKPGQPGASKWKTGSRLGSKELIQLWKLSEQRHNVLTGPDRVRMLSIMEYWRLAEDAKKESPGVYSATAMGHSTTSRGFGTAEDGTTKSNGSSTSVRSSTCAANTLGSGGDDPNDEEGQKCVQGSDTRAPAQKFKIGRREQLDNLNPADVILELDRSSPIEEISQILRAGQARNFQFVQDKIYYEAVYYCICRNSEAKDQEEAPAAQEHGQELPAAEPVLDASQALENEQDVDAELLPAAQAELADLLPEGGIEPLDDDSEAMEKEQDADYSLSNSAGPEEDNDTWLQFPDFLEEDIAESLDLPAINVDEVQEMPEETSDEESFDTPDEDDFLFEEEGPGTDSAPSDDDDTEQDHDADYSPSNSAGPEEDNDTWLQFPDFFDENIVENLDLPAIDVDEDQEVSEEDKSNEEGSDTDEDDFLSDAEDSDSDTTKSNGSSTSVRSSTCAANTLGSGDDDPNDEEGQKCVQGSDTRAPAQKFKIGRREQLDNLNPADVILELDRSSPIEEISQILRAGQARNFQFVQDKIYYEAVYYCICRNSEAEDQEEAPAAQEHGQELPAAEPVHDASQALENEQDVDAELLPAAQAELADLLPEGAMEPLDDDGEAMEKERDADYSLSNSAGPEEDNDTWLQFPDFLEEDIAESLDLPAINVDEVQEMPEETSDEESFDAPDEDDFLFEEEGPDTDSAPSDDDDTEQDHDADYSPSNSAGSEEDNDTWLQFPDFFDENIVENLDLPAIDVDENQEVSEEDKSNEEGSDTDEDDFLSDAEDSDSDSAPSEDEGDDWLQFPFFFEEEDMDQDPDADYAPSDSDGADESDDRWLQFSYFFEEDIADNLDLPGNDSEEMPAAEHPNHESDGEEENDEQWMLFPEQSSESEEEGMTSEETSDEVEEDNSDPDYAPTEEEDPNADETEWWFNTDFMDDLYTESESDSDDKGMDPDYCPSSGSDDAE